ncbi:uncharacterized protein LOC103940150 isoform X1 [Pyrus x bretschneideri]|uniref:uncharacterized protein LOC103940150 isoform X1 n=1 Tax=Pyrus x bretschneideri TaxID=225117 RepID=UPI00051154BF|nr:uncharacterized protein LOC103940150 isoform X1 [Pyrus x bretschneideri]
MGSLTEEQLMQMVRDFNESYSSDSSSSAAPNSNPLNSNRQPNLLTLQDLIWKATDCEIEILEKILKHLSDMGTVVEPNNLKNKWVVRKLNEDGYEASLCKTSWVSSFRLPKAVEYTGGYEYVDVMVREKKNNNVEDGGKVTRLIVDMDFRSQFEVARPTQNYKQLKDALPTIFVGTEAKLDKIISLLCSAAKQSLRENGLVVPPWRKASYMQSKWLSKDCKKISI